MFVRKDASGLSKRLGRNWTDPARTSTPRHERTSALPLERQRQPVSDGEHGEVDAAVAVELPVERADVRHPRIVVLRVGDAPVAEDVVDGDEAARADEPERPLVVGVVLLLVGVDKGEVERAGVAFA